MKKLLYFLLLLLLLLLMIFIYKYCRGKEPEKTKTPTTACTSTSAKNAPEGVFTQCYREEEYVINFPKDPEDKAALEKYLKDINLHLKDKCPCSDSLQLWGGVVRLAPDGSTPPPPKPKGSGSSGITRNYIMTEKRDSIRVIEGIENKFNLAGKNLVPLFRQSSVPRTEVKIAIIDSGMDLSDETAFPSPFLFRNGGNPPFCNDRALKEGNYGANILNWLANPDSLEPFDTDGHGTFIHGIITSQARMPVVNNANNDFIGDNEDVALKILHVRFARNRESDATLFDALCGVHYAINKGAKVINASWRALANDTNKDSLKVAFLPTLRAIKQASAILVASAGNDHLTAASDNADARVFPAIFSRDPEFSQNVIAVGAWDLSNNKVPDFSNEGSFVDFYAPGVDIQSKDLRARGGASIGSGTSYAAPYVSRLVAILLGKNVPVLEIKERIKRNSETTSKLINQRRSVNDAVN
jgi:Subtilase family